MAKVLDQHLGTIRGKVGNTVFKMIGSKSFAGKAPKKYKETKSELVIYNRKRFLVTSEFASAINDSSNLKELWKKSALVGKLPFHKICKANYLYARSGFMNTSVRIVPGICEFENFKLMFDESVFEVKFSLNEDLITTFPPPYIFIGFIQLTHPANQSSSDKTSLRKFITLEEFRNDFDFKHKSLNKFRFNAPENSFRIINDYKLVIAYFAVISKPPSGTSCSCYSEGTIIKGDDIYSNEMKKLEKILLDFNVKYIPENKDESDFIIRIK
jgi:hypothetical protein